MCGPSVIVPCHEATDAADRLAEGNGGPAHIGRPPERQLGVAPEEDRRREERADEAAVEIAGAREHGWREQLRRCRHVLREGSHDH